MFNQIKGVVQKLEVRAWRYPDSHMGAKARIRKASLWNEQDIVHHIYTGLEIYRHSITAGHVSNDGTDLLRHGSCWPDRSRDRTGLDRP